jgi:hypothetical protein
MVLLPVEAKQAKETKTTIRANFIFEKKIQTFRF